MKKYILAILIIYTSKGFAQKYETLCPSPPMGWNSWNTFQTKINEKLVMETVPKSGDLIADPEKFPHGMKALADYVHSKGLKFGLYNCAGTKTCAGYPGTRGYEYQDARNYAAWGVDYLKFDWCNTDGINAREAYTTMSKAIRAAGRPMIFSLCEWGNHQPWLWAKNVGQLWRSTGDIHAGFDKDLSNGSWSS